MTFDQLTLLASQVIETVQRRLPAGVREAALALPVICEPHPSSELIADGLEPDTLGLFVGHGHLGEIGDNQPMPPQVLLFVENIWELAEYDEVVYRREVRITYLHELGHYLGWDEDEIARQGLE
jgi:predicted Zn-dependent protease with MMP-like domain